MGFRESDPDICLINMGFVANERAEAHACAIPLGLSQLCSVLHKSGSQFDTIDYQSVSRNNRFDINEWMAFVRTRAPLLGISTMEDMLPFALACLRNYKMLNPEKYIILGGPGPSGCAPSIIQRFPFIDAIAIGESEDTIQSLISIPRSEWAEIPGVVVRENCYSSISAPKIVSHLDDLPFPDFARFPACLGKAPLPLMAGRGCPFSCSFCETPAIWGHHVRRMSIGRMIEHIKRAISSFGVGDLFFADDVFTLDRAWVLELCQSILEVKKKLSWRCFSRIDLVDEELLEAMAKAGCKSIFYGVESGSNKILESINKGFTYEEARENIELSLHFIPKAVVSLIYGYPFENNDDFKKTIKAAVELRALGADLRLPLWSPRPMAPDCSRINMELILSRSSRPEMDPIWNCPAIENFIKDNPDIFMSFYCSGEDAIWKSSFVRQLMSAFQG
jgi:radical SAM superfamily enzyme YgiQ (UPF0313 family)